MRGAVQPAIKAALAVWHEPLAAAAIGYSLSTVVIMLLVGRRALVAGPADRTDLLWFIGVGMANGTATLLLYAALGLGSIAVVAPLVATSYCCWWEPDGGGKAAECAHEFLRLDGNGRGMACVLPFTSAVPVSGSRKGGKSC